jgi:hypothetical protein
MPTKTLALCAALMAACGGAKDEKSTTPPGEAHATPSPAPAPGPAAPDVAPGEAPTPLPPAEVPSAMRPALPPGTTIELKNDGDSDLVFGTTKGWQPVIFAFTGKPPKAKPILLFESFCTATCSAPEGEVCPVCREPANKKEELKMAKSESAAPGGSVKVPWDGKMFVYEKAPGKHHCKCWNKADPPADTYTVRACGLRPSKVAGKASKPTCAETQVTLGGASSLPTITLSFK